MNVDEEIAKIPARVQYGIMFAPGIHEHHLRDNVDLQQLQMHCDYNCIGGQIYKHFAAWLELFSITDDFATDLGFWAPKGMSDDEYRKYNLALEAEWTRRILLMREPVTQTIQHSEEPQLQRVLEDA